MSSSLPLGDLADWLESELVGADENRTAVLAGHYAIFSGGAKAVDLLESQDPAGGPADMLDFTKFTWDVACHAVGAERNARLLVLVDDNQFVIPMVEDKRTQEQLAAALAAQYMAATPTLPEFHQQLLTRHRLDDTDIFKQSDDRWLFSERELRIAHVRRIKELVRTRGADAPVGLTVSDDMSRITVTSEEHGEYCLVHSGRTTCAGGYVELLCTAYERGIRTLITLVPMRCLGPITVGTALGTGLMGLDQLTVVNIAIPDVASGVPAAMTRTSTASGGLAR